MKLDKRIINGKRPLTCFDIEEAEKYIGKLCYMCDEYNLFYQLNLIEPAILMGVEDCEIPFHNGQDKQAEFCLPCEWITKKKKFRPYTVAEFQNIFKPGYPVKFRPKDQSESEEMFLIFNGYKTIQGAVFVYFGHFAYTLNQLFEDYEWQEHYTDDYKPFGVEE